MCYLGSRVGIRGGTMAYSIFMLPEGQMTVSGTTGGAGLDGVTQGDGSHMVGATITLQSRSWQEIEINDSAGDTNFQDSDTSQTLVNSETVETSPGSFTTFAAGTMVEAEYGITVTDPDGNTYQLVAFNFSTGSPAYGTIEGLAFIGPEGGFPPINVPLTVISAQEGPNYSAASYATPICFAAGTVIATPSGGVAIEDLAAGDLVTTLEGGAEPIRWIGRRSFPATGRFAPVVFAPGAIGNTRALAVSRQHRLMVRGWRAELLFGADSVWVPAVHFLGMDGVHLRTGGQITYLHLLLDGHRTLLAEGVEAESLHPGDIALGTIGADAMSEIDALFPEVRRLGARDISRPALRGAEARAILAA